MALDPKELEELNAKYDNMEYCYGPSNIFYPGGSDGSRLNMATQNQKQFVSLLDPDVPRVATGYENAFGRYSKAFKKLEGEWKVVKKIQKFGNDSVYTLVLYQKETDTYDMIEKQTAVCLSEKFGYSYNTEFMDSLEEGQIVRDPIMYKSRSYDEHMNYRLGKNARVFLSSDTATYEDAIKVRRGFLEKLKYTEVDKTLVPLNNNDVLLFMHGNKETGYKTFPDVGEVIEDNDTLCASRRINNMYATYDFLEKNLTKLFTTDSEYRIKLHSVIYDINVYSNSEEEIPDNDFYKQVRYYHECCCRYAEEIYNTATDLKKCGSNITDNVSLLRKRYALWNNPEYKWKLNDKAFSNIVIEFKTMTTVIPKEGCKLVGRYGDKGVISKICTDNFVGSRKSEEFVGISKVMAETFNINDESMEVIVVNDESMPYRKKKNGERVYADIVVNGTGAFRRENTDQLYEIDITFVGEQLQEYICEELTDLDEKFKIIMDFIGLLNQYQAECYLNKMAHHVDVNDPTYVTEASNSEDFKKALVAAVEKDGFYITKFPSQKIRYMAMKAIYERFKDIVKPYQLYVEMFGMEKPLMREHVMGWKYMYLLKQTSNKNFSARSTGRTTKAGIPAKSSDKKENRILSSNTPISISELNNLSSQIRMTDFAEHNILVRTSLLGRKALEKLLKAPGDPLKIKRIPIKRTYTNIPVQILQARLKVMGLGYKFVTPRSEREEELAKIKQFFQVYDYTFFDTLEKKPMYHYLVDRYNELVRKGKDPKSFDTWKGVMELPETKVCEIPQYIVDTVMHVIYDKYFLDIIEEDDND